MGLSTNLSLYAPKGFGKFDQPDKKKKRSGKNRSGFGADQADDVVEKEEEPVKSDPPKDDKKPDKKPKKKKDDDKKKKGKEFSLGDDWEGDSNAQMAFAGFCAAIIGAFL